ncbi:MAG: pantetheine-phosphate adenylyltransferase [Pseudomonadota bacterium]
MKITAIYPGTFDPVTRGHIDVATRAAKMFDRVVLAVAESPGKKPHFNLEERCELAEQVFADCHNIDITSFRGLMVDFADQINASVIVRGLRAVSDFDYEVQLANLNRQLNGDVETVFVAAASQYTFVSSSMVREISSLGGDVSPFVDPLVEQALKR